MPSHRPNKSANLRTYSQPDAAELLNVSTRMVTSVKAIEREAPEYLPRIENGEMTVNAVMREVTKAARLENNMPVPDGKYRIVYADPPWKYGDTMSGSLDASYGGAEKHYPSMSTDEICSLPIKDLAESNAVLFLWATSPLLEDAFRVIKAWGFDYKTSFVWDKIKHNFGHYNSVRHEFLLICTRGSCTPDNLKLFDSVQSIERTEKHSQKPEEFREIIDTLYTHGKRIELFGRASIEGWDRWGNEPI